MTSAPLEPKRITDVETLKAIAHPLRSRLLTLLNVYGPATATELGRRVGESSGSTSYHLRQLERYGFIEDDPEQSGGRERRWRPVVRGSSWSTADFVDDPEALEINDMMERRQAHRNVEHLERWFTSRAQIDPRWLGAAGVSDDMLRLTPSQARRFHDELIATSRRYRTDPPPPDDPDEPVAYISLHVSVLPFEELPI
jgi:DNA-binding transcriptional ArsR family regulator